MVTKSRREQLLYALCATAILHKAEYGIGIQHVEPGHFSSRC